MSFFSYNNSSVHYAVKGQGQPLLLLHGNTASSRMFLGCVGKLAQRFQVIGIDYPGHGKSQRLYALPGHYWLDAARAAIALCGHLGIAKAHLLGSSGGAWAALNMALLRPDLVGRVVADSAGDDAAMAVMAPHIPQERQDKYHDLFTRLFWRFNHGRDWKNIVEADSRMIVRFAQSGQSVFCGDLAAISCPVLLTGCADDELIPDIGGIYERFARRMPQAKVHLFPSGGHAAVLGRRKEFLEIAKAFLEES